MNDDAIEFVELEGEMELTPPEIYASNLIEWATERHCSDLFVSDLENSVLISVRRLGRVEPLRRLARQYGHRLQGHFRVLAGADAGELIHPVEGRGVLTTPGGLEVDLRLSAMPTLWGQDVAIRLFDPVVGSRSIEHLGFDATELTLVRQLLECPSGLLLVSGPAASGKSTTLYAAIESLNDGSRKIHTLEDPIEHALPGVMQTQVNQRAKLDYPELLATVGRHSPDVIMIGEIRDALTATTAVRAGASGQLVLASLPAKSSAEAVDTMLQFGVVPKFLAGSLIGVINQRLVRRLCESCRVRLDVGPLDCGERIGSRLNGQPPTLYRPGGCEKCFDDGFASLTCVPEIMIVDPDVSQVIAAGGGTNDLEQAAMQHGMLVMAEAVLARVYNGTTTPSEGHRAVADPQLATLTRIARQAQAAQDAQGADDSRASDDAQASDDAHAVGESESVDENSPSAGLTQSDDESSDSGPDASASDSNGSNGQNTEPSSDPASGNSSDPDRAEA